MLRFLSQFQADIWLKSEWIEPFEWVEMLRFSQWWSDFENMLSEIDLYDYVENVVVENYPDFSSDDFRDRDYHAAEIAAENELGVLIYHIKRTFNVWIASLDKADSTKRILNRC